MARTGKKLVMRFRYFRSANLIRNTFISFSILFAANLTAADLNISDVPLELTPSVPPNVFILADDSGSMDWEILTQNSENAGAYCSDAAVLSLYCGI